MDTKRHFLHLKKISRLGANISGKRFYGNPYKYSNRCPEHDVNCLLFKIANFASAIGWCNPFMSRYELCIRTRTKIAPPPPPLKKNVYIRIYISERTRRETLLASLAVFILMYQMKKKVILRSCLKIKVMI